MKYLEVAAGSTLFALAMWFLMAIGGMAESMTLAGSVGP